MKLALRLAVAGTAAAAVTAAGLSMASASTPTAAPSSAAAQHQHSRARLLTAEQRKELRTTGHVHVIRHTRKHGDVGLDLRLGKATVTPNSVTVLSKDGSSQTFSTDGTTKVRSHKQPATVHSGDRVLVLATSKDGHARRVVVRRPAATS